MVREQKMKMERDMTALRNMAEEYYGVFWARHSGKRKASQRYGIGKTLSGEPPIHFVANVYGIASVTPRFSARSLVQQSESRNILFDPKYRFYGTCSRPKPPNQELPHGFSGISMSCV